MFLFVLIWIFYERALWNLRQLNLVSSELAICSYELVISSDELVICSDKYKVICSDKIGFVWTCFIKTVYLTSDVNEGVRVLWSGHPFSWNVVFPSNDKLLYTRN